MKRIRPPVDKNKYKEIPKGLSEYERSKVKYTHTHFTFTRIKEGKYEGFDKVTYYRENLLEKVARSTESSYI